MRRTLALGFLILGVGALITAGLHAREATDTAELIGSFLPGPLLLAIAFFLDRGGKRKTQS